MSDKRTNSDEPGDLRVSRAYREMADERTPEHLDHVILNAARSAAKPRWNKALVWLRPAAWVATIGLCLAIVIEILLLPDPEPDELSSVPSVAAPPAATSPAAAKHLQKTAPRTAQPEVAQFLQEDSAPATLMRGRSATNLAEEAASERYCDETATADPNSWLECILELERQGLHEAARLERERLALAFPPPELP